VTIQQKLFVGEIISDT